MKRKEYYEKWNDTKEYIGEQIENNLTLGEYNSYHIMKNCKHFMISMSRYKFVTKMLKYKKNLNVLEIGCSEGLGGVIFSQETDLQRYLGIDQDERAISWAKKNWTYLDQAEFICEDLFNISFRKEQIFDAVFSLDVIEHIETSLENEFMEAICKCLRDDGCAIIGTPNEKISPYASEPSKIAHINLYSHERLYNLMSNYFENVFMFSMNDEVVSTGFEPMACYIFAVGAGKKDRK